MVETAASGWLPTARDAWAFLAVWFVVVVTYGLWRSRGDAVQDPIRLPGPIEPGGIETRRD